MPELNVAPSPSPVAATVDPAATAKASPADGVAASGNDGQATTPFATVLQHQMQQPADAKAAAKAAKAVDALLAAAAAATDATAAAAAPNAVAVPDDALAYLAPMLPGIAPATTEQSDDKSAKKDDGETGPTAGIIAAPLSIAVVANAATAAATQTTSHPTQVATATDARAKSSAILAAENAAVAEASADNGKTRNSQQAGFDALLNASREASATAASNTAAHASHGVAAQAVAATTVTPVTTPVGAQGWDREVGEKIVWMAGRQDSRAELVLNPPNMGRIEVSLSMNGDQATATFVSGNAAVREALENAVPRLREILQDAGISLGQAQVGAESFQQSANNRENGDNASRGGGNARAADATAPNKLAGSGTATQWLRRGNSLVDTFA